MSLRVGAPPVTPEKLVNIQKVNDNANTQRNVSNDVVSEAAHSEDAPTILALLHQLGTVDTGFVQKLIYRILTRRDIDRLAVLRELLPRADPVDVRNLIFSAGPNLHLLLQAGALPTATNIQAAITADNLDAVKDMMAHQKLTQEELQTIVTDAFHEFNDAALWVQENVILM